MISNELMLKIEGVSKIYKLGEIGGTTLRDELQRLGAKIRKKEDPTKKINAKNYNKGEKFKALNNISLEIKKGERIGIIGHNGAGKSTLLKLISRVTGPTEGTMYLNGRVASMLEVGTGFHPELTGRENIYMNGAILGMTKKEIDAKIEDIIEFSEVRQFIDTPVKRYSSGMYVKLAFSVAAHLDSEIMIMDEVLAVGDVAFQNKCLTKMRDVSEQESRTILYVSHNMNTIRQLCDRVVVMSHGTIVFDGDVEEGISTYINKSTDKLVCFVDTSNYRRSPVIKTNILLSSVEFVNNNSCVYERGDKVELKLTWESYANLENILIRIVFRNCDDIAVASTFSKTYLRCSNGRTYVTFLTIETDLLVKGIYLLGVSFCQIDNSNNNIYHDSVPRAISFEVIENGKNKDYVNTWNIPNWGSIHYPKPIIKSSLLKN